MKRRTLITCSNCHAPNSNMDESCSKCGHSIFETKAPDTAPKRTLTQNKTLHSFLNTMGLMPAKENLVLAYTEGRTGHSSEMTVAECGELIKYLGKAPVMSYRGASKDKMRKKIIGICHDMGWKHESGKIDMERIDAFLLKRGYVKKKLNDLEYKELSIVIHQFEMVRDHQFKSV